MNNPIASSVVATGLRMNGSQMFTARGSWLNLLLWTFEIECSKFGVVPGGTKYRPSGHLSREVERHLSHARIIRHDHLSGHCDESAGDDESDSDALHDVLEREVLPAWEDRAGWLALMRSSIAVAEERFTSDRMVREYAERLYRDETPDPSAA